MADTRPQPSAEPVGDLIERIVVRAGKCGHHFDPNCEGCLAANRWTNEQLDEQRSRIAALEADNARLMGLVKEAGEDLVMLLRQKTPTSDDCYTFRLTADHIRWAKATLAKIKENTNG